MNYITQIDNFEYLYLKRDDLYMYGNSCGGKARTIKTLLDFYSLLGYTGIVTVGSRSSVQIMLAADISYRYGKQCHLFIPAGEETPEIQYCKSYTNVSIHPVSPGHTSVIIRRAKDFAQEQKLLFIPWGLEMKRHVELIGEQTQNIPQDINRIVVPVGSGMTAIGIALARPDLADSILGVQVGADPHKRFKKWLGRDLKTVESKASYSKHLEVKLGDIVLDPGYEAKCYPFLEPGDLFWISGRRII